MQHPPQFKNQDLNVVHHQQACKLFQPHTSKQTQNHFSYYILACSGNSSFSRRFFSTKKFIPIVASFSFPFFISFIKKIPTILLVCLEGKSSSLFSTQVSVYLALLSFPVVQCLLLLLGNLISHKSTYSNVTQSNFPYNTKICLPKFNLTRRQIDRYRYIRSRL